MSGLHFFAFSITFKVTLGHKEEVEYEDAKM